MLARNFTRKAQRTRHPARLGLIAGEGIMGVLIAAYAFFAGKPQGLGWAFRGTFGEFVALAVFALLGFYLVRKTRG